MVFVISAKFHFVFSKGTESQCNQLGFLFFFFAFLSFFLYFSRFLYPGKNGRLGDFFGDPGNPSSEFNPSGSKDGKYELLTAANDVIAEEIKDLMTKSNHFQLFSIHYCYLQIESNVEVFEVSNPKI